MLLLLLDDIKIINFLYTQFLVNNFNCFQNIKGDSEFRKLIENRDDKIL